MSDLGKIKKLRQSTGAGFKDCNEALKESLGDIDKAIEILRVKGISKASKKMSRDANEGVVAVSSDEEKTSIIEVNCETDFVARTDDFETLAHDLAMQVAAMSPQFVYLDYESDDGEEPDEDSCLVEQNFIKDQSVKVKDVVSEVAARVGENIRIKRFSRFSIGE